MRLRGLVSGAAFAGALALQAEAASLRVAPVLLDVAAPQQASSVTVWNSGETPIDVQVRVMRWRQVNGEDILEPTADVVASPPISTLSPGGENVIRIVRVTKAPSGAEESYRLLVDELPDPSEARGNAVALVLRQSIPVFFGAAGGEARVAWRAAREAGGIRVTALNTGSRRLRIANLKIDSGGRRIASQEGLAGYVLGGQTVSWVIPAAGGAAGPVVVSADSEAGHFDAVAAPAER